MSENQVPVGIDLGTTFSAVAFVDSQGRPNTIENSEGESTTPSVVFFDRDDVVIGTEAELAGESEPARMAKLAKRDMGGLHYSKTVMGHSFRPEVVQSLVLDRIKKDAQLKIGNFEKAVITVPAYFNEPRRKATQDAGQIAGIDVIDIINEPTAAALAYGVQRGFLNKKGAASQKEMVLVYDLGGGTFDVTLMEIDGSRFSAVATGGDVYLGGVDWDQAIFDHASERFRTEHRLEFANDATLVEKLLRECTRAKKSLSARAETIIRFDADGTRFKLDFSRQQFEQMTRHLLERTRLTTDRLLNDAKIQWSDLTKLLLVGGSTRMPMVARMLEKESGLKVDRSISPDESVAHGAALYAGILMQHGPKASQGISVQNVNSHDLGVLGIDPNTRKPRRQIVIPRNQVLPAMETRKFQTSRQGQTRVLVQVVEGGTDSGQGATHIGKCVVEPLPSDLAQGTTVMVDFKYSSAGRLEVVARLPSHDRSAESSIDRARGMNAEEIAKWRSQIENGFELSGRLMSESRLESDQRTDSEVGLDRKPDSCVAATGELGRVPDLATGQKAVIDRATLSQVRIDDAEVDGPRPSESFAESAIDRLALSADNARTLASESVLDFLGDENRIEPASQSDSALHDFLKGLD